MIAGGIFFGMNYGGLWRVVFGILASTAISPVVCGLIKPSEIVKSSALIKIIPVCGAIAWAIAGGRAGSWSGGILGLFAGGLAYYLLLFMLGANGHRVIVIGLSSIATCVAVLFGMARMAGRGILFILLYILLGFVLGGLAGCILFYVVLFIKKFSKLAIIVASAIAGVFLFDKVLGGLWYKALNFFADSFWYKAFNFFENSFGHKALGFVLGGLAGCILFYGILFIRKFSQLAIILAGAIAGVFLFDKVLGGLWYRALDFFADSFWYKTFNFFESSFGHKALGFVLGCIAGFILIFVIHLIREFPKFIIILAGAIAGVFLFDKVLGGLWYRALNFFADSFWYKAFNFFESSFGHKTLGSVLGCIAGILLLGFIGFIKNLLGWKTIEYIKIKNDELNEYFKGIHKGIAEKNSQLVLASLSDLSNAIALGESDGEEDDFDDYEEEDDVDDFSDEVSLN
jgi:hypothetical protein